MATTKLEVEVEHPDNVRVVDYRAPENGERILSDLGNVVAACGNFPDKEKRFIVEPIYRPPECIPPGRWIYRCANSYYLTDHRPQQQKDNRGYLSNLGLCMRLKDYCQIQGIPYEQPDRDLIET